MNKTTTTTTPPVEEPGVVQRGVGWALARFVVAFLVVVAVLGALYYAFAVPALLGPVALVLAWAASRALKRTVLTPVAYAVDAGIGLWLVELPDRDFSNRFAQIAYEVVRRPLLDVIAVIVVAFVVIGVSEGDLLSGLNFGAGVAGLFAVLAGRVAVAVLVRRARRAGVTS